jgi:hypothetical protein
MVRKLKQEDIKRGAILPSEASPQLSTRLRIFGGWLSSLIRRSCTGGMWTISRDGKLVCESLGDDACQPD